MNLSIREKYAIVSFHFILSRYAIPSTTSSFNASNATPPCNSTMLCSFDRWPYDAISKPFACKLLIQDPQLGEEDVVVHICTLEPSFALGSIKRFSSMQHSSVVEDDTLALIQPILKQILLRADQLLEGVRRRAIIAQGGLVLPADAGFKRALEGRGPIHAVNGHFGRLAVLWIRVELDGGARVVIVVRHVVVVVGHRKGAESTEVEGGAHM